MAKDVSMVWSPISHQTYEVCSLADAPEGHPDSAHPKIATIHYHRGSDEAANVATSVVLTDIHPSESVDDPKKGDSDTEIL